MIELKQSTTGELEQFVEMEASADTTNFIMPYSIEQHRAEIEKPDIVYLSIYAQQALAGFIILAIENNHSIEFRRIVVATKGQGIGQLALNAMEKYCAIKLNCKRIWLDVFEENSRGVHIYKKLGYLPFKTGIYNDRPLIFMEKVL